MAKNKNVKVIDHGWDQITKNVKALDDGLAASVGVQGAEAGQGAEGTTNVEVGSVHEYGSKDGSIPERSHWRKTFDEKQKKYQKELDKVAKKVLSDKNMSTIKGDMRLLGEDYKTDVLTFMGSGALQEKADGSPSYLWDTGEYAGSFSVVLKEGKE